MFQYQKRSTTDSFLQVVATLQYAIAKLAQIPADHSSGLGHLLQPKRDTILIATGCGDHAPQVANQPNARHDRQGAHIISATRPDFEEYRTIFMTCYTHLTFKLKGQKYQGESVEQRGVARLYIKRASKSIYYSSTGGERDWLWELMFMISALTRNTDTGLWFREQYQQPPWPCWQYTASGLPGASGNNNLHESFWKQYKTCFLDDVRAGHNAFFHEVFPRPLFQLWPSQMGPPLRQCKFLACVWIIRIKKE